MIWLVVILSLHAGYKITLCLKLVTSCWVRTLHLWWTSMKVFCLQLQYEWLPEVLPVSSKSILPRWRTPATTLKRLSFSVSSRPILFMATTILLKSPRSSSKGSFRAPTFPCYRNKGPSRHTTLSIGHMHCKYLRRKHRGTAAIIRDEKCIVEALYRSRSLIEERRK